MLRLVVSDLDGTLLNHEHSISAYTKSVLNKLYNQGYQFAFATGRHYLDVERFRDYVGIPAYMITANGASIIDPQDQVIYRNYLDQSLSQSILSMLANEPDITTHFYTDEGWFSSVVAPLELDHYHQTGFNSQYTDLSSATGEGIYKFYLVANSKELMEKFTAQLVENFANALQVSLSGTLALEVNAAKDSKGQALIRLSENLGISLSQIMAFGDGMNDLSMLQTVGQGFLMANADPRLFEALPHIPVLGSNANESVAKFIEERILKVEENA